MHRRGYAIILAVILLVGIVKETIDALRLGWHHTSILDKVGTNRRLQLRHLLGMSTPHDVRRNVDLTPPILTLATTLASPASASSVRFTCVTPNWRLSRLMHDRGFVLQTGKVGGSDGSVHDPANGGGRGKADALRSTDAARGHIDGPQQVLPKPCQCA